MTHEQALAAVRETLASIVPDADFDVVGPDTPFRSALELDSLDFLTFVERLTARTGCRIDEDDYPRLTTMEATARFLTERG